MIYPFVFLLIFQIFLRDVDTVYNLTMLLNRINYIKVEDVSPYEKKLQTFLIYVILKKKLRIIGVTNVLYIYPK